MLTRVVVALIGLAVLLPAIIFGGEPAVEILGTVAMLIALEEYGAMAFPGRRVWAMVRLLPPGVAIFAAVLYGPPGTVALAVVFSALWIFLAILFRSGPVDDATNTLGRLFLGLVYVPGLLVFLPLVRRFDDGLAWVFLMLAITWLGDAGAYFAGRLFGKRKLYEKISPKKTWEGAIGGAVVATAGVFVIRAVALPQLGILDCIVLGVVVDAVGVMGDLAESMLKRSFGVKDSGKIMPGHGGLLDRIDALLFTGPVVYLYLSLWLGL